MKRIAWPALAILAVSHPSWAQRADDASASDAIEPSSFPSAFFAEFRPNSALDMINRLPGFTYNRGNSGVRGLAGSGGNVLIDGQRPVTKSLSLDDVIRQIPVDVVVRIEVIRSGAVGIDMQGHPMVANIIRNPNGFTTVTGEIATKLYDQRHLPARVGRLETALSRGRWSATGAMAWRDEREQGNSGTGRILRQDFASGRRSVGHFMADWNRRLFQVNGSVEYRGEGDMLRLNFGGESAADDKRDLIRFFELGMRAESVLTDFTSDQAEISLDYERALSTGLTGRIMALQKLERDIERSASAGRGPDQESADRSLEGESILRLAATYISSPRLTFEASAEGSFNFLNARSRFARAGIPVILPAANVRVEEKRANLSGSLRWQAASWSTLDAGLGLETSTLVQSGDTDQSKSLHFWKPRISAAIDLAVGWQVRLRAEQIVGQLNFADFAASVSLEPGNVSAGNPNLVPERSWLFEAAIERNFWDRGAITVTASHAAIRDAIDLIPIDNRFDAPGNVGNGWRKELRLALTLPLERLAMAGTQVRLNSTWRRSRVTDPVTRLRRRISRERPISGEILVTKDLPALDSVIGMEFFMGFEEISYRLNEIRTERSNADPLSRLYWEWNPDARTAIRFQIENFTFRQRSQQRLFFDGSRASGAIVAREDRSATMNPFLMVRLRRRI